jgi:hypothetical protein
MELSNPWLLISGLFLGAIGMGLFIYGKKQLDFRCIATGVALCVVPYFIGSLAVLWLVGLALVGGLWAWMKYGG